MGGSKEGPVWLAAAVFAFGCASADAANLAEGRRGFPVSSASAPAATSITIAHYSIEIPVGYEVKDVSAPMMDFDLYRVTRQGSKGVGCGFYFGNAPGFPKLHWWWRKAVETNSDNRTTTAFQRPGATEGLIKFSGLTYKTQAGTPWTFIHYLCDGLDEVAMKDVLGMIASIKVVRPHVD